MSPRTLIVAGIAVLAVVVITLSVSLVGRSATPSPLEALEMDEVVAQYDDAYWAQQRLRDPELWSRAKAVCDGADVGYRPNCRPVLGWMVFERTEARERSTSPGLDPALDLSDRQRRAEERLRELSTPRPNTPK